MKENSTSVKALLPVLFGFFIMGFCDVVGISTSYVKSDFGLSETIAGFLPSMVFLWFLLLAVPAYFYTMRYNIHMFQQNVRKRFWRVCW